MPLIIRTSLDPTSFPAYVFLCLGTDAWSGRLVASDFMELPSRKRYPDYFATIKKPIALDMISARVENDEYDNMEALKADLALMTSNAKKYNVKESSIYEDAIVLQVLTLVRL